MLKHLRPVGMLLFLASMYGGVANAVPVENVAGIETIQQNGTATGVVKDALGEAVIGASVVVKGTTNGTITDFDGNFSISNVKKGDIIQISFVGYQTQEIAWNGQAMNIILKDDAQALEEVVVVGYGTQKKVNLTGAVAAIDGDVLEARPITNIGQGLQGVVPNLQVSVSGAPGAGSSFMVRGDASINGGSPLVLVDNVQMDPNLVNPEDIASISVLKDAASAAIYGARAAYGVILITTKTGKKESKPQISFNASGYWSTPAVTVEGVNSIEYLTMRDVAYQNSGGSGSMASPQLWKYAQAYLDGTYKYTEFYDQSVNDSQWQYCGSTDWFKELYKTNFSQQYNVSMNGGNENTTYYASVGFADQKGILAMTDDNYKKYNMNINLSSQITKWMKVSGKIMHTYSKENHPTGSGNAGVGGYGGMLKSDLSPLMPITHSHTGRLIREAGAPAINDPELGIITNGGLVYVEENRTDYYAGQGGYTNPFSVSRLGGTTNTKKNDLWVSGALQITPMEGLIINADYTWNFYSNGGQAVGKNYYEYRAVAGTELYYPWTNPSYVKYTNSEDYYNSLNLFAEYSKKLWDKHNFKLTVGYNQEYKHSKYYDAYRNNLISTSIPDLDKATGEDKQVNSSEAHWGTLGYFARLNYNYDDRYLFEFNGRYDGSSKFPKGDRYGFFPSFSFAWRASQEGFWEPVKEWWNDLKVRASYGSLGNQAVSGNFPYLATYGTGTLGYLLDGTKPLVVTPYTTLVAKSLTWETVNQINFGIDLGFFNNRLTGSFDIYRRDTKDMMTPADELPAVLGAGMGAVNNGSMKTTGWELSLGWQDRLDNGFNYWAKFALSDYISEITAYNGNVAGKISGYYVGRKIGEIWGLVADGLFQTQEEVDNYLSQKGLQATNYGPGDVKYVDVSGDGKIAWGQETIYDKEGTDKTIIGNSTPRYQFGITLGAEYKNFDLEMFFQGVGKRDANLRDNQFWSLNMNQWQTPTKAQLDYWTPENTDAYYPAPNWNKWVNREASTRYLQDASYMRLKNITLGYNVPKKVLNKLNMNKLRLYVTGENLLTFTNLIDGYDPETLGNLTYPITKKVAVGMNLTF